MKHHILLACLLGSLTVGYVLIAPTNNNPDSIEQIAYIQRTDSVRISRRFLRPNNTRRTAETVRRRGMTALV